MLRLDKNKLSDKSAVCLSQLIQTCLSIGTLKIEELSISDNLIGAQGIIALFAAVAMSSDNSDSTDPNTVFENTIADIRRQNGKSQSDDQTARGGSLVVLNIGSCRPDLSVLDELSHILRRNSMLSSLDLTMSRHVARDISQEPGFVEAILTLAESVGRNVKFQFLELGDLQEVCNTAAGKILEVFRRFQLIISCKKIQLLLHLEVVSL